MPPFVCYSVEQVEHILLPCSADSTKNELASNLLRQPLIVATGEARISGMLRSTSDSKAVICHQSLRCRFGDKRSTENVQTAITRIARRNNAVRYLHRVEC